MNKIQQLQKILDESERIVFFTGAGVSTESGIPDFRSVDGLYNQDYDYPPEQIISHTFFYDDTSEFYRFYRNRMIYETAKPNAAHLKMAEFEKAGKSLGVVTQNIDGLHQMAGSEKVFELHGSIHRNYCLKCHQFYGLDKITKTLGLPKCDKCGSLVKPDVVLYEEGLDEQTIMSSIEAISKADTLVITGTSLVVYPAAGLVNYFRGKNLIVINKTVTPQDQFAQLVIQDSVGKVLSQINV